MTQEKSAGESLRSKKLFRVAEPGDETKESRKNEVADDKKQPEKEKDKQQP